MGAPGHTDVALQRSLEHFYAHTHRGCSALLCLLCCVFDKSCMLCCALFHFASASHVMVCAAQCEQHGRPCMCLCVYVCVCSLISCIHAHTHACTPMQAHTSTCTAVHLLVSCSTLHRLPNLSWTWPSGWSSTPTPSPATQSMRGVRGVQLPCPPLPHTASVTCTARSTCCSWGATCWRTPCTWARQPLRTHCWRSLWARPSAAALGCWRTAARKPARGARPAQACCWQRCLAQNWAWWRRCGLHGCLPACLPGHVWAWCRRWGIRDCLLTCLGIVGHGGGGGCDTCVRACLLASTHACALAWGGLTCSTIAGRRRGRWTHACFVQVQGSLIVAGDSRPFRSMQHAFRAMRRRSCAPPPV